MSLFARVDGGLVAELIADDDAVPMADRFHPDIVAALVEVPAGQDVAVGWHWDGEAFGAPAAPAMTEGAARARRDALLAASDWTQLGDAPLAPEVKIAWASYRAALRAVPAQPGFPAAIAWPVAPLD